MQGKARTAPHVSDLSALQNIVVAETTGAFEQAVGELLGNLLETTFALARSGFQHGSDMSTAGRSGRDVRVECKRYRPTTSQKDRELQGEIDQVIADNPSLEVWVIAATNAITAQTENALQKKADLYGLPVLVIDWKATASPSLAALLASDPAVTGKHFGTRAQKLAARLQPALAKAAERLRRELQTWHIGFESLRLDSLAQLQAIRRSPATSVAQFGQVIGQGPKIVRTRLVAELDAWWAQPLAPDSPMCIVGDDGVGKSWAVVDWLDRAEATLPIALLIPASAAPETRHRSPTGLKDFLAERLYFLTGTRDIAHWRGRVERLLARSPGGDPVFLLVFDGMNQEPDVDWRHFFQALQAEPFAGRVRAIATTRQTHFEFNLHRLKPLLAPAIKTELGHFDDNEFDQMLALSGLTRSDVPTDLVKFARNPRLFALVLGLRGQLAGAKSVTLHRLLLEYGRDTLGQRAYSEAEWHDWLRDVATRARQRLSTYTIPELAQLTHRANMSHTDVDRRLSEIVDGIFAEQATGGKIALSDALVEHALGLALVEWFDDALAPKKFEIELDKWLDPISGLVQRANVLRAAVSIALATNRKALLGPLTIAWLQTQNLPNHHRQEILTLAPALPDVLLEVVERSSRATHASTQRLALTALRGIDRGDARVRDMLVTRATRWLAVVSRDVTPQTSMDPEGQSEKHRSDRLIKLVGRDQSGPMTVLGVPLMFVDRDPEALAACVPAILEGYPLADAVPAFVTGAVASVISVMKPHWGELKWICLLNESDSQETAEKLRAASAVIAARAPEPGVHSELPLRVAAFLLWLTGYSVDEDRASVINPRLDRPIFYDTDYLSNPAHSFFALERRHAELVLADASLNLIARARRLQDLWLDPYFTPPTDFCTAFSQASQPFPVEGLFTGRYATAEAHQFELLELPLARCDPAAMAALELRWAQAANSASSDQRYWRALEFNRALVLHGPEEAEAARRLRLAGKESRDAEEARAANELLMAQVADTDAWSQAVAVIESDLTYIYPELVESMSTLSEQEVHLLLAEYGSAPEQVQHRLLAVLLDTAAELGNSTWTWVAKWAHGSDEWASRVAFRLLTKVDAGRWGEQLVADQWRWQPVHDAWIAHYGSQCIVAATSTWPFDQVAACIAPWWWLAAARRRGADNSEIRLAAQLLDGALRPDSLPDVELGALVTAQRRREVTAPFGVSIAPLPHPDPSSPEGLGYAFDDEAQHTAYAQAHRRAWECISTARREGAPLFLVDMDHEDFRAAWAAEPALVEGWLQGVEENSKEFQRRLHAAEGPYIALCEALLHDAPIQGALLWRRLRTDLTVRVIGPGSVPELLHLLFRAPDTSPVRALLEELFNLPHAHTDRALFEFALAAALNGRQAWVEEIIASDATSPHNWRKRRAATVMGFLTGNSLPVPNAWPEGETTTSLEGVQRRSARFRHLEACAQHWWREYWSHPEPAGSYAAWVLFRACADRRAEVWMDLIADAADDGSALYARKRRHVRANPVVLKEGADKSNLNMDRHFLHLDADSDVAPWRRDDD